MPTLGRGQWDGLLRDARQLKSHRRRCLHLLAQTGQLILIGNPRGFTHPSFSIGPYSSSAWSKNRYTESLALSCSVVNK
jgi:hypothetical protein